MLLMKTRGTLKVAQVVGNTVHMSCLEPRSGAWQPEGVTPWDHNPTEPWTAADSGDSSICDGVEVVDEKEGGNSKGGGKVFTGPMGSDKKQFSSP